MKIIKTKINFQDERGLIRDVITATSIDAITFITCKNGSIRGNHYHNKTMQYDYILKGSFECYGKENDSAPLEKNLVTVGDTIIHQFPHRHAYKALEDSEMISCTFGPRQGDQYEDDTFRLKDENKLVS